MHSRSIIQKNTKIKTFSEEKPILKNFFTFNVFTDSSSNSNPRNLFLRNNRTSKKRCIHAMHLLLEVCLLYQRFGNK